MHETLKRSRDSPVLSSREGENKLRRLFGPHEADVVSLSRIDDDILCRPQFANSEALTKVVLNNEPGAERDDLRELVLRYVPSVRQVCVCRRNLETENAHVAETLGHLETESDFFLAVRRRQDDLGLVPDCFETERLCAQRGSV